MRSGRKWQGFLDSFGAKNWLDVKRRLYREYGGALDLVHKGNTKPVFYPSKTVSREEAFPQLAALRSLARLSALSCDALVADNRSAQAATVNMDMLTLSMNIRGWSTLSNLVGVAIQAISLSAFDANLDRFSERDWQMVLKGVDALLARGNRLSEVADAEVVSQNELFATTIGMAGEDGKKLTPAQQADFLTKLNRHLKHWSAEWKRMVALPESEWKEIVLTKIDPAIDEVLETLTPASQQMLMANAKATTQLRLLKLHAMVQIFRYQWGKLPESLKEAVTQSKDRQDPLATGEFQFEKLTERSYRLYSKGNKEIGEIDLRFKRQGSAGEGSDKP